MFYKVKNVNPLPNYKLSIQFINGITKIYDITPLIEEYNYFKPLKEEPLLFNSVTVDQAGHGIILNKEIDISSNELWTNGKK